MSVNCGAIYQGRKFYNGRYKVVIIGSGNIHVASRSQCEKKI